MDENGEGEGAVSESVDAGLYVSGGSYWLMDRRDFRLLRVGQKALRREMYRKNAEADYCGELVEKRRGWMKEVNTVEDRLKDLHRALLRQL